MDRGECTMVVGIGNRCCRLGADSSAIARRVFSYAEYMPRLCSGESLCFARGDVGAGKVGKDSQ
ncbi:hypothetical protein RRSWK_06185 [Rhodopirellula sp. SWK7]|nr:hypothetical protein RRSWK_06185 [Rhodopirellula sp. SWK7]